MTDEYCRLLHAFAEEGIDANVAFKLTHVGLDIDPELALENATRIVAAAAEHGNTVRFDMEQSDQRPRRARPRAGASRSRRRRGAVA